MLTRSTVQVIIATGMLAACSDSGQNTRIQYPETRMVDSVDTYFGTQVPDPYRWLEDDNSKETKDWVEAQNEVTFAYLESIPYRDNLRQRLEEIWNYPRYSAPWRESDKYFYYHNDGLQNQDVLYIAASPSGPGEVFLDPNQLSADGTVSLSMFSVSPDGKYAAYGTAAGGSDWNEFHVMTVDGRQKLDDHLEWIKFSGASWYNDGFVYSRFPEPKEEDILSGISQNQFVCYHKLGTPQSQDIILYRDTLAYNYGALTEDKTFMVVGSSEGTSGNTLKIRDMRLGMNSPLKVAINHLENDHEVIGNDGDRIFIYTNLDAPNYRLVETTFADPTPQNWKDLIPEQPDMTLSGVTMTGGRLFANYMKDASTRIKVFDLGGKFLHDVQLPGIGTAGGFGGKKDHTETFYTFASFTTPAEIYRYDIATNTSTLLRKSEVKFNADDYETKQVWYQSKDGTKIPMFIVHKKGIELNGKNPTMLYGYGGFNISLMPSFSLTRIAWLEQGGIFAQPSLRGGGEYGEEWHKAGMLLNKQNVFDDFIAAAEYLIAEKYTSKEKLAVMGRSNGGLLVGAVINQRPDLCAVALPGVGVMDMLRYHKFTVGHGWVVEYGSSDDSVNFSNLIKYSPLHNIREAEYPATLVTTADHDDRVVPAHSFKYISELQRKQKGDAPVLIRVDVQAGHGAGKPTSKTIDEWADVWAFTLWNVGVKELKD